MKLSERLLALRQEESHNNNNDFISRQQQAVMLTAAFSMVVILPLAVLGITGASGQVPTMLNAFNGLVAIVVLCLYILRYIKSSTGLILLSSSMTLFTCAEMFVSLYYPSNFDNPDTLITGDIGLLLLVTFLLVVTYLPKSAIIISAVSMACYIICMVISESSDLEQNLLVFSIIFIILNFMGVRMVSQMQKLRDENATLKDEEQRIIEKLGLNKEQVVSLVQLSDNSVRKVERNAAALSFMESISPEARHRLITTIENYVKERETALQDLSEVFPELSPSEIAICRLILQDKSTSEICVALDKTRGNVSSQRVHIRTKLGLQTDDNLVEYLKQRMANSSLR